jgi:hypothetical protein
MMNGTKIPEKIATSPNGHRNDLTLDCNWYETYIRSVTTPVMIGVRNDTPNIDIA